MSASALNTLSHSGPAKFGSSEGNLFRCCGLRLSYLARYTMIIPLSPS